MRINLKSFIGLHALSGFERGYTQSEEDLHPRQCIRFRLGHFVYEAVSEAVSLEMDGGVNSMLDRIVVRDDNPELMMSFQEVRVFGVHSDRGGEFIRFLDQLTSETVLRFGTDKMKISNGKRRCRFVGEFYPESMHFNKIKPNTSTQVGHTKGWGTW